MRYRSKPVEIDAVQFLGLDEDGVILLNVAAPDWFKEAHENGTILPGWHGLTAILEIQTMEGTMSARISSWIARGTHGELYPIKDSVFQHRYEKV